MGLGFFVLLLCVGGILNDHVDLLHYESRLTGIAVSGNLHVTHDENG